MVDASPQMEPPALWAGQGLHALALLVLLAATAWMWPVIDHPAAGWFWAAIALPILHQTFVWLAWRSELNGRHFSRKFGFGIYLLIFFVLFLGRFVSLAALAWADQGSLGLDPQLAIVLAIIIAVPGLYAMYSVQRYFGMKRAAGADHFDPSYRDMPLVRDGIFRFTDNGMYVYAFLLFWAIAIGLNSLAALWVAGFSHAYIWVHYVATEKPDMDYLYGQGGKLS